MVNVEVRVLVLVDASRDMLNKCKTAALNEFSVWRSFTIHCHTLTTIVLLVASVNRASYVLVAVPTL